MLPPMNSSTMERNPRFARLYQEMVQSRLNPDTTTKVIKQQRAAVEIEKLLHEHKTENARQKLIEEALRDVIADSNLPQELTRSCQIMLAVSNGDLTPAETEVLKDDVELFHKNVNIIAAAISAQVQSKASMLATFLPSTNPDPAVAIGQLPAQTADLISSITTQAVAISAIRSRIADLAAQVQSAHADVLETAIRVLEQTMHGSVARGVRARAEHLSIVAKGLDMKVRILAKNDPLLGGSASGGGSAGNEEELIEAVAAYNAQLDSTITELEQRLAVEQAKADGYAGAGRGMEQIAERYAQLLKQRGELELEVQRLQQSAGYR